MQNKSLIYSSTVSPIIVYDRSRKAKIIIPDVSYLFPKGNQLWNDDPAEAVLKSVEGLYVKEPQGRTGLSPLRLPTPFITHLLVIDEKTEKKLEQAMELFCRRMDIIQGLMCINGSKTEVRPIPGSDSSSSNSSSGDDT